MKHEESDLQKACVRWFRYQHPNIKIIASLNGIKLSGKTKLERIKQWNHLKAMEQNLEKRIHLLLNQTKNITVCTWNLKLIMKSNLKNKLNLKNIV